MAPTMSGRNWIELILKFTYTSLDRELLRCRFLGLLSVALSHLLRPASR